MSEIAEDTLLDVDAGTSGETGDSSASGDQGTQVPFLEVDERTKYATKEDALKGYSEAGKRIAQLSGWEKELEPFGVKDPRVAAELFRELQRLREGAQKPTAVAKVDDAKPSTQVEKLSDEEAKARVWLQKAIADPNVSAGVKAMFKDQLGQIDELKKQLDELKSGRDADSESRTSALVEDGEAKIGSLLKEAGIEGVDEDKTKFVASVVKTYLEAEQERVDRFFRGGASLDKVVREGYDWAMKQLGWKGAAAAGATSQTKGKALASNKTLPAGGSAAKSTADGKPKQAAGKPDLIGNLADKAWETFQKSQK